MVNTINSEIPQTLSEPIQKLVSGTLTSDLQPILISSNISSPNLGFFETCTNLTISDSIFRIQFQFSSPFSTIIFCRNAQNLTIKNVLIILTGGLNGGYFSALTTICQNCTISHFQLGGNLQLSDSFTLLSNSFFTGKIEFFYVSISVNCGNFQGIAPSGNAEISFFAFKNSVKSTEISLCGNLEITALEGYIQSQIFGNGKLILKSIRNVRISVFQNLQKLLISIGNGQNCLISNDNLQFSDQCRILTLNELFLVGSYSGFDTSLYEFSSQNLPRFKEFLPINAVVSNIVDQCVSTCQCQIVSNTTLIADNLIQNTYFTCKKALSGGEIAGISVAVILLIIIIILIVLLILFCRKREVVYKVTEKSVVKPEKPVESIISTQKTVLSSRQLTANKSEIIQNDLKHVKSRDYMYSHDYPREISVNLVRLGTLQLERNPGFFNENHDSCEIVSHLPGNMMIIDQQLADQEQNEEIETQDDNK